MTTQYCPSCGALLTHGAAVCGECGARLQDSPFARRPTDMPAAWAASEDAGAPADAGPAPAPVVEDDEIQPLQRQPGGSLAPAPPSWGQDAAAPASTVPEQAPSRQGTGELEPPLDGCAIAGLGRRILGSLLDGLICTLAAAPLVAGLALILVRGQADLLSQILLGVGVVLTVSVAVLMVWLQGTRAVTPAGAALGLRTVRTTTGRPLGIGRDLLRWLLLVLPVVSIVAALWVLTDARKRRGLHDRAAGSVVVDVRRGRNPLVARPDDYARPPDSDFLPDHAVAVGTHANLTVTPGAPWGHPTAGLNGEAWGQAAPATAAHSPWEPQAGQDQTEQDQGAQEQPGQEQPPQHQPEQVQDTPQQPAAEVAEETIRRSPSADEDLDTTRVVTRSARIRLHLDEQEVLTSTLPVLLGRRPRSQGGAGDDAAELLEIHDPARSISGTHVLVEDGGPDDPRDTVRVTDLGSTNGTALLPQSPDTGAEQVLKPDVATAVPSDARLRLGDRIVRIEVQR